MRTAVQANYLLFQLPMRIAIASSGLGHVARGIETWAEDTAVALAERAEGRGKLAVTLFTAGNVDGGQAALDGRGDRERSTFNAQHSTSKKDSSQTARDGVRLTEPRTPNTSLAVTVLPCWRRSGRLALVLARLSPRFTWRWGLKSAYGWEQLSFWRKLEPELRRGEFDILHVQDPMLAYWCRRARLKGRIRTQEILAHGTEESPAFRAQFPCLQELAPWHLGELHRALGTKPYDHSLSGDHLRVGVRRHLYGGLEPGCHHPGLPIDCEERDEGVPSPEENAPNRRCAPLWVALPNFVDTGVYRPVGGGEKEAARARWGIPAGALVIGCVAALKCDHKRLDHLVSEVSRLAADTTVFLLMAGATTDETSQVEAMAGSSLPGRSMILRDVARADVPSLYRCMDVFVLPSLFEMMPIAVLEAMASGLPVLVNDHPNLAWMVGERTKNEGGNLKPEEAKGGVGARDHGYGTMTGGICVDMEKAGELADALRKLTPGTITELGTAARKRAEAVFAKGVVVEQYVRYYEKVMGRMGNG